LAIDKNKISEINIKSVPFQEILDRVPSWILRWGNTIFLIVFLIFLLGLYFIKYPDTIISDVKIESNNPSITVRANLSGKVSKILKNDQDLVKSQDWIILLENDSNYNNLKEISDILLKLESNSFWENVDSLKLKDYSSLGDIRGNYTRFKRSINEYKLFLKLNTQTKLIDINKIRQNSVQQISKSISKQQELLKKERDLILKNLKRNRSLYERGVISKIELEKKEIELINIENKLEDKKSSELNSFLEGSNIKKENFSLTNEKSDRFFALRNNILNNYNNLLTEIEEWKKKYVLIAPVNGILNLYEIRNNNQFLSIEQKAFTVTPKEATNFFAFIQLPVINSGKVQVGQKVIIKLHDYPYTEYGVLEGNVLSITKVPLEGMYLLKVELPNQLKTSINKNLDNRYELTGIAEVITHKRSLLSRMFNFLKNSNN
jgi:HlyD family secretion protein